MLIKCYFNINNVKSSSISTEFPISTENCDGHPRGRVSGKGCNFGQSFHAGIFQG